MTTANVNIKKVLLRRGNTTQNNNYLGVYGEVSVDMEAKTLRIHDGVTTGGNILTAAGAVGSYSNTNVAAYLTSQSITSANIGAFQTYANSNAVSQTTEINSLRANITAANVAITNLQSNAAVQQALLDTLTGNAATQAVTLNTLTSNAATQADTLNTLLSNAIAQQTSLIDLVANAATQAQAIANVSGTYSNSNVKSYLGAFDGNILPSANVTYGLGDATHQWKDLWVSNNTIYIGNTPIRVDGGTLLVNNSPITGGASANLVNGSYTVSLGANGSILLPFGSQLVTFDSNSVELTAGNGQNSYSGLTSYQNGNYIWVDDNGAYIGTNWSNSAKTWTFNTDGNLTIPGNINYANGVSILSGVGGGGAYGNTQVAEYLANFNGIINFTASPAIISGLGELGVARAQVTNSVDFMYGGYPYMGWQLSGGETLKLRTNIASGDYTHDAIIVDRQSLAVNVVATLTAGNILTTHGVYWANGVSLLNGLASQGYVDTKISDLVDNAPALLNTLGEIAANLAVEANAVGSILNSLTSTNANVTAANVNIAALQSNAGSQQTSINTLLNRVDQAVNMTSSPQFAGLTTTANVEMTSNVRIHKNLVVDGNINFIGNVTQTNITTANAVFTGDTYGFGALYAGVIGYTPLPYTVIQTTADYNDYSQINFQNLNLSANASTEYVATAGNGDDATNYIDLGIAGGAWNGTQLNSIGTAAKANDAWLYVVGNTIAGTGGNLVLGTIQSGKRVNILTGGPGSGNIYSYFDSNGLTTANVYATRYLYANGVSILTGIGGTYSNTNVAGYLAGSISTGNINVGTAMRINGTTQTIDTANGSSITIGSRINLTGSAAGYSMSVTHPVQIASNLTVGANSNAQSFYGTNYFYTNGVSILSGISGGGTYSNTNVEAYIGGNIGAFQIFSNANSATQQTNINSINANIGAFQTYANATFGSGTSTGNITFSDTTISTSGGAGQGIILNSAGAGEIAMMDYVGINNTNPGYWLHIGDGSLGAVNNTGNISVDYNNGLNSSRGSTILGYAWWDTGGNGNNNRGIGAHRQFGIYKNDDLYTTKYIEFDLNSGNANLTNIAVTRVTTTNGIFWSNGTAFASSNYGNTEVAAYLTIAPAITGIQANLGAFQTFSNSNSATQQTSIDTVNANLGSFQTYANTTFGVSSYGNTQVAAYLLTYPSVNVATLNTTSGNIVTLRTANFNSANAVISGGYVSALTNASVITATLTTVNSTAGNITTLAASNFSTANAVVTGGYATGLANISVTGNATVGNLVGTSPNTTIISGAYTSTFDNVGNVILPNLYVSGNTTAMGIAAGYAPNRPAFRVYGSGNTGPLTTAVNGNGYLNGWNFTADYNQGNYLNTTGALNSTTAGVFTAPVAGLYQICLNGRNAGNLTTISQLVCYKNPTTTAAIQLMLEFGSNSSMNHTGVTTVSRLATGDTLALKVMAGTITFDGNDNWSVTYIG